MTREQLEEIKKLAEAATPGPWRTPDEGRTSIWSPEGHIADTDRLRDAAFICALREHALPLIKALREAWEALEQVSSDDRMSEAQITAAITEAQKDRDEAQDMLSVSNAFHDVAVKERDYERAVNARLRAALERIANPAAVGSAFHEEAVAIARRAL